MSKLLLAINVISRYEDAEIALIIMIGNTNGLSVARKCNKPRPMQQAGQHP